MTRPMASAKMTYSRPSPPRRCGLPSPARASRARTARARQARRQACSHAGRRPRRSPGRERAARSGPSARCCRTRSIERREFRGVPQANRGIAGRTPTSTRAMSAAPTSYSEPVLANERLTFARSGHLVSRRRSRDGKRRRSSRCVGHMFGPFSRSDRLVYARSGLREGRYVRRHRRLRGARQVGVDIGKLRVRDELRREGRRKSSEPASIFSDGYVRRGSACA